MHNNGIVRRFLSLYLESRATPGISAITNITWLMLFIKKTVALSSENHTKCINTLCKQHTELCDITAGGAYRHH
jgi:hypothetical protein